MKRFSSHSYHNEQDAFVIQEKILTIHCKEYVMKNIFAMFGEQFFWNTFTVNREVLNSLAD